QFRSSQLSRRGAVACGCGRLGFTAACAPCLESESRGSAEVRVKQLATGNWQLAELKPTDAERAEG
ncbi:MAG TPA: hypothetical protein VFK47_19850, partial [Ktedonobacteraceae bacterium]|nr:hypothetical protein [Ktedonobacteraceae bacterium]